MRILARPLDESGFARYGTVIRRPVVAGRTGLDDVLSCTHPQGRLRASMTRVEPQPLPRTFLRMERHAWATQLFMPLGGRAFLALVALGAESPEPATLAAWVVPADIGIAYRPGVWHVPMTVLGTPASFLVLMHRIAPELDEDWHTLEEPIEVSGPATQDTPQDIPKNAEQGG